MTISIDDSYIASSINDTALVKEYHEVVSLSVDVSHQKNLVRSFMGAGLINANCVGPQE